MIRPQITGDGMNRKQRRAGRVTTGKAGGARSADAHGLYVAAHGHHLRGELDSAKAFYMRAFAADPDHPGVLLGLGLIAFKSKLFDDAERYLRQAIALDPQDTNILSNLGAVLLAQNRFDDCIAICNQVLASDRQNANAQTNLKAAQARTTNTTLSVAEARHAVALSPDDAKGHANLAKALLRARATGHDTTEETIVELYRARALDLTYRSLDLLLAELLIKRGRASEALAMLSEGAEQRHDDPLHHHIVARAAFALQDYHAALASAERYRDLAPTEATPHAQIAMALSNLRRQGEALNSIRRALELDPEQHQLRLDMCQIRQLLCDWDGLEADQLSAVEAMIETESFSGPFHLLSMPNPAGSAENQLRCARIYQARLLADAGVQAGGIARKQKALNKTLKIGYLSNDYRDHATALLISEMIERHDRARFEISAYCYTPVDDGDMRERLRAAFDRFVDVKSLSLQEAADRISNDGIDILVDLKGYTQGSRTAILAFRPAPIQVNYLGFPGTLGSESADYIIGDAFLTPFASQAFYSEKIVQLPHSYQPNDTKRAVDDMLIRREDYGLPREAFVFASFNNNNKLTRPVFHVWMRSLDRVPGSVFWIYATSKAVIDNLSREAQVCGINPDRLHFTGTAEVAEHVARMQLADVFLDSFPCTAHTTASEALWAGLPLVTCAGETFASRVAGSILRAADLPELVTHSLEDYEALAFKLATDPTLLSAIRLKTSRAARTPLFDIAAYTRDLERAYLQMAEIHNCGREPEAFAVRTLPPAHHSNLPS